MDGSFIIVKNNAFLTVLQKCDCTANKAVAVFFVEYRFGADNGITRLSLAVKAVTGFYNLGAMIVAVKEQIRLDIFAHKACPFGIELLLDIKRKLIDVCEGNVRDDQFVLNALGIILVLRVFDNLLDIFGLAQSKGVEADRSAVFGMVISFILAAIQKQTPDGTYAEGIIGFAVHCWNVVGHILGETAVCAGGLNELAIAEVVEASELRCV